MDWPDVAVKVRAKLLGALIIDLMERKGECRS